MTQLSPVPTLLKTGDSPSHADGTPRDGPSSLTSHCLPSRRCPMAWDSAPHSFAAASLGAWLHAHITFSESPTLTTLVAWRSLPQALPFISPAFLLFGGPSYTISCSFPYSLSLDGKESSRKLELRCSQL